MAEAMSCYLESFSECARVSCVWASVKAWLVGHWDLVTSPSKIQTESCGHPGSCQKHLHPGPLLSNTLVSKPHPTFPFSLHTKAGEGGWHVCGALFFHRCPWCPRGACLVSGTNKGRGRFLPLLHKGNTPAVCTGF